MSQYNLPEGRFTFNRLPLTKKNLNICLLEGYKNAVIQPTWLE